MQRGHIPLFCSLACTQQCCSVISCYPGVLLHVDGGRRRDDNAAAATGGGSGGCAPARRWRCRAVQMYSTQHSENRRRCSHSNVHGPPSQVCKHAHEHHAHAHHTAHKIVPRTHHTPHTHRGVKTRTHTGRAPHTHMVHAYSASHTRTHGKRRHAPGIPSTSRAMRMISSVDGASLMLLPASSPSASQAANE